MQAQPTTEQQRAMWDRWNIRDRTGEVNDFMRRQIAAARAAAATLPRPARILEVGCGTGWLADALREFGDVTGTDLSASAIEFGRKAHPGVRLVCGDFATVQLDGPYDFVVSADTIAHVESQELYVARIAELLKPGGTFLLMTQNPFVWNRISWLYPPAPGQIRNWPTRERLAELFARDFEIRRVSTVFPDGDRGLLMWVRYLRGAARRTVGLATIDRVLEACDLGRELVVDARRRPS